MTIHGKNPKSNALYIHIPFCDHLCHYCNFSKLLYVSSLADDYLTKLIEEINHYNIKQVSTIYIGGGTPSSLSESQLNRLLHFLRPLIVKDGEFTTEVNVENATENKLQLLYDYGVNRLSIGVQSFNDKHLNTLNRHHDKQQTRVVIKMAKDIGFSNISVDLLHDIPGSNKNDLIDDLNELIKLEVDHISTYALEIVPNTVLYIRKQDPTDEEIATNNYEAIINFLRNHGYKRYEVSNFARNNRYSKHNLTYWRNLDYYGVGLGASGYLSGVRYQNTRSMSRYLKGEYRDNEEIITEEQYLLEYVMLALRMEEGFFEDDFVNRIGYSFKKRFATQISSLVKQGLFIVDKDNYCLTDKGMLLLDTVVLKLLNK